MSAKRETLSLSKLLENSSVRGDANRKKRNPAPSTSTFRPPLRRHPPSSSAESAWNTSQQQNWCEPAHSQGSIGLMRSPSNSRHLFNSAQSNTASQSMHQFGCSQGDLSQDFTGETYWVGGCTSQSQSTVMMSQPILPSQDEMRSHFQPPLKSVQNHTSHTEMMLSSGRGVPEGSLGEKCGVEKLVERAMLPVKKELETIKHRLGSKGGVPSRNVDDTNAMKLSIKKIDKSLKKLQDQVRKSQNLFQKDRKELFGKVDAIRNEVTAIRMQWKAVNDKFSAFDFDNQKFWFASLERMTKENLDNLMDDEHMTRITTAMKDCISDDSENFLEDLYDTDPYHLCSALKKIKRARKKAVK